MDRFTNQLASDSGKGAALRDITLMLDKVKINSLKETYFADNISLNRKTNLREILKELFYRIPIYNPCGRS